MPIEFSQDNFFAGADWRSYTPADGLAGLMVEDISQDANGFLWMTTPHGGVCRFDGEEFRSFAKKDGISTDHPIALLRDRRKRLWFAGMGDVTWYDGETFHAEDRFVHSRGFTQCIMEDRQGRIWFWGAGSLAWRDDHEVGDLLPEYEKQFGADWRYCWGMGEDPSGDIWLGGQRLVRYDGDRFHDCGADLGLLVQEYPYLVGNDARGDLWFAGSGRIMRFDGQQFEAVPGQYPERARVMRTDREGRLWIAFVGEGVYCVQDDRVCHVGPEQGLPNQITDIFQDREGLLWFATWGHGIRRCDPDGIRGIGHPEQLVANSLQQDRQGRIWMNLGGGLGRLDGARLDAWRHHENAYGRTMAIDGQGQKWCGGDDGLARWNEETGQLTHGQDAEACGPVTSLTADSQGRLLVAHENSTHDSLCVARHEVDLWETILTIPKGGPTNCFTCILPSRQGHLWLGSGGWGGLTTEGGLARLDEDGRVTWWRYPDDLIDHRVEDLCEDRHGRIWVATRGGVSCFDGEKFTHLAIDDGLPLTGVLCVCEDQQGDLWFGAEDCVVHYDGQRLQTIRSPLIRGAISSIILDRDGVSLWFATSAGVVKYVPTTASPKVRLLRVMGDRTYDATDSIEIPASSGQVVFEYRGLSLRTSVRDLLYTCRLEGVDEDWRPATRERQAAYEDLEPGPYTFLVKAIDRDLNHSEPAAVQVNIVPDPRMQGLAEALSTAGGVDFVGESSALRLAQAQLAEVARTDLTVLIQGETGTGKGLAARAVHAMSQRKGGPLIQINCGALPETLIESELFGHEKGAFTGAHARRLGRVELAAGGTLFLDEIGDMSLDAQVQLLRLLEEGTYERVGGTKEMQSDTRVIAATNRDLEQMVEVGAFRTDLFYRLQVFPVRLPPLRERRDDVELLALYFIQSMATHLGKRIDGIEPEALAALQAADWPGNVRELEHTVQRAVVICQGSMIRIEDVTLSAGTGSASPNLTPEEYERHYVERLLAEAKGVISGPHGAAARWGIPESSLRYRMKKLGIHRP